MMPHDQQLKVGWALATIVMCSSCGSCELGNETSEVSLRARFIVESGYEGPVYLIHDPDKGMVVPIVDGQRIYRFPSPPVLRVRSRSDAVLNEVYISAEDVSGKPLWLKGLAYSQSTTVLTIQSWAVLRSPDAPRRMGKRWTSVLEQLVDLGIDDLLKDEIPAEERRRREASPLLPTGVSETMVHPRFVVPRRYFGPVFLILDPDDGAGLAFQDGQPVVEFGARGIARIRMDATENASAELGDIDSVLESGWPLVFEEGGKQLWLRPLAKTGTGKYLPIAAFMVCRTPYGFAKFSIFDEETLVKHLRKLGERELEWEDSEDSLIGPAVQEGGG